MAWDKGMVGVGILRCNAGGSSAIAPKDRMPDMVVETSK